MTYLISPTEPQELIDALEAIRDAEIEERGADIGFYTNSVALVGIQRKEIKDLIASLRDGRLARECSEMRDNIDFPVLIIEGNLKYLWEISHKTFTKAGLLNLERSLGWQFGIRVEYSNNLQDTAALVFELRKWFESEHLSLFRRPKLRGQWGKEPSKEELGRWILQSFPGIGPKGAATIIDYFGEVPLAWTKTEKQLREAPGVGKLTAQRLTAVLPVVKT